MNRRSFMRSASAVFFPSGIEERLELAIRADDAAALTRLIAEGAPVNARGRRDVTPMMIAVDAQARQAVAILLRSGALPNAKAADGTGPVHLAVENHATQPHGRAILEMILHAGGDPNTRRPDGDPILMRFVYDHDLDDLRWLKSLGADVDIKARTSRPVIADIAWGQNWDAVWCLIELGARVDYEGTTFSLSEALNSPYASSPDATLYPYKLKVWQFLRSQGIAVVPFVTLGRPGGS
jgi:hypothetical protein